MAQRSTFESVIKYGENYESKNQLENKEINFVLGGNKNNKPVESMNIAELQAENERVGLAIRTLKQNKAAVVEQVFEENGISDEFNKRIDYNDEKIRDLHTQIDEQEKVIKIYQGKFTEFQDNLGQLMKLDKDIHSKLVNPPQSSTLEKNVKNVMVALNSGASYADLVKMIDSIKV